MKKKETNWTEIDGQKIGKMGTVVRLFNQQRTKPKRIKPVNYNDGSPPLKSIANFAEYPNSSLDFPPFNQLFFFLYFFKHVQTSSWVLTTSVHWPPPSARWCVSFIFIANPRYKGEASGQIDRHLALSADSLCTHSGFIRLQRPTCPRSTAAIYYIFKEHSASFYFIIWFIRLQLPLKI